MTTAWQPVPLGSLLKKSEEVIWPVANVRYTEVTVRLWGRGVVARGEVDGLQLVGQRRFRARRGQFIASRIDARNGALGVVPTSLDGAIVTNDFPLFYVDPTRLEPAFLNWLSRTERFVELCRRASEGTTNRVRLKEERFLALEISLPAVDEQRRIVARIEAIAEKVEDARRLREEAGEAVDGLLASQIGQIFGRLARDCPSQPLGRFDPHVTSGPRNWAKHYEVTGHRFYRAQDIGPSGAVLNDSKVYVSPPPGGQGRSATLAAGDLMIVITGATVGRVALFTNGMEPGFVSQHVAICRLPRNQVNSEFVLWGLRGPVGQSQLLGQRYGQGKPGLNLDNVAALSLPFPSIEEQQRVVRYLRAYGGVVEDLAVEQKSSAALMSGMLSSVLDKAFRGEM